jgi:hypothetical protein
MQQTVVGLWGVTPPVGSPLPAAQASIASRSARIDFTSVPFGLGVQVSLFGTVTTAPVQPALE